MKKIKIQKIRVKNNAPRTGIKAPNFKEGKSLIKSYCIDCNKQLGKLAFYSGHKRCKSCAQKFLNRINEKSPLYIDGRSKIKFYCIECNKEINRNCKRCKICHNRYISKKFGFKIKEIMINKWKNIDFRNKMRKATFRVLLKILLMKMVL